MKQSVTSCLMISFLCLLFVPDIQAQTKSYVLSKPFVVNTQDTIYSDLRTKLPQFICEGLLVNSSLKYKVPRSLGKNNFVIEDLNLTNKSNSSSSINVYYKSLMDSLDYLMEGEMTIINGRFFIYYYVTNFKGVEISYTSRTATMQEFQNIVDEACTYLNFRIRNAPNKKAKEIYIRDFTLMNSNANDARYTSDFPAQYLSLHLQKPNETKYTIFPRSYVENPAPTTIKVGGTVWYDNEKCFILPVIYFNEKDSLRLTLIEEDVDNIDALNAKVRNSVRSFLDIIIQNDTINTSFVMKKKEDPKVYISNYDKAVKENKLFLAYYYADQLELNYRDDFKAKLLKAKIHFKENDYEAASAMVNAYLEKDSTNLEANYIAGSCAVYDGNYESALNYFNKVLKERPGYEQVYYQKGLALYYGSNDSLDVALRNFLKQKPIQNKSTNADLNYYIAKCYEETSRFDSSEYYYVKMYKTDTSNVEYKKRISSFYFIRADESFERKEYSVANKNALTAYSYYKDRKSLEKSLESMILNKNSNKEIEDRIKMGIKDSVLNTATIYLNMNDFCKKQKLNDKNEFDKYFLKMANAMLQKHMFFNPEKNGNIYRLFGSNYYRLQQYDSAEYYYQKVKQMDPNNPIHYFNIIEVQLIQNKTNDAFASLQLVRPLINGKPDMKMECLYSTYLIAAKIIKGQSYKDEKTRFTTTVSQFKGDKSKIIYGWNFLTFYNWVSTNDLLKPTVKTELSSHLCSILQYSPDKNLPCP